ncbi:hypothetical protein ACJJTC_014839 [Scirpophaga incertulas]
MDFWHHKQKTRKSPLSSTDGRRVALDTSPRPASSGAQGHAARNRCGGVLIYVNLSDLSARIHDPGAVCGRPPADEPRLIDDYVFIPRPMLGRSLALPYTTAVMS